MSQNSESRELQLEIDEIFSNDVLSQSKVLFVNNFNSLVLLIIGS